MIRSRILLSSLFLLGLAACVAKGQVDPTELTATGTAGSTTPLTGTPSPVDADGDGFTDDVDCDDGRVDVNPDADELCNGVDDNCDGVVDTDAIDRITTYADLDGDGSGDDATASEDCTLGPGRVQLGGDCNDNHPGLNARDDDADGASTCDGDCDDADPALNLLDADLDGYDTCSGDCDDADDTRSPYDSDADGQSGCDGDCDDTDPAREGLDADGDGFSTCDGDCDDTDDTLELTDLDGDTWTTCDGDCDDHNPGLNLTDADGDTWSTCAGDCDDSDGTRSISDVDLDGQSGCAGDCDDTDPAVDTLDADSDGWTSCDGDCDDTNPAVHPGAVETCDAADRDCDGDPVAGAVDQRWWFVDLDGDGYGVSLSGQIACDAPSGTYVDLGGDCNDNVQAINPGMPEDCADGVDNDCSGVPDDCGSGAQDLDATDAIRVWRGALDSESGKQIAAMDHDGDGIYDLLIGAQWYREINVLGRAWLVYGGNPPTADGSLTTQADATFTGNSSNSDAGEFVGSAGDMDGDGYDEMAIAAPHEGNGEVRLLFGGPSRWAGDRSLVTVGLEMNALDRNSWIGNGLGTVGDLNGDGFDDLAFSAPNTDNGHVYFLMGNPVRPTTVDLNTLPRFQSVSYSQFALGHEPIGHGDWDGDGFSDVAMGGRNHVFLLYGSPSGPLGVVWSDTLPDLYNDTTDGSGDDYGNAIASLDYDGDGREDLVVADPASGIDANQGGAVWFYPGSAVRWTGTTPHTTAPRKITGTAGGRLGGALEPLPDIDGDGDDELLVGAYRDDGLVVDSGNVYLFEGDATAGTYHQFDADLTVLGSSFEALFGSDIEVGDFDGDGRQDLVVSARFAANQSGRIYLFSNPF